jgi:UDP-N-acetylmuramoyl-tripeptide--D-alanyl-D-alanine ligase
VTWVNWVRTLQRCAREAGIGQLFALGELSALAVQSFGKGARHFPNIEELLAEVGNALAPDLTVLVKGSRFMQMERIVEAFRLTDAETVAGPLRGRPS